jgi:hypothetical protein
MNKNSEMQTRWQASQQNNYGTPAISLSHGKGALVWDADGKEYLDFLGGIATNILGHAHPKIVSAITDQAHQLGHVSNLYSHPRSIELAEKLISLTGESSARVFFCNSGAEANEAALKLSRLTGRSKIVSTFGSFHGRTMGSLSLTGQVAKQKPFKPLLKRVKFIPFNDIAAAKKAISNFKLREGLAIGVRVTLRRERMWAFLDRLNSLTLPRVRDFRGLPSKGFDGRGNYNMGLKEQIVFPEINYDRVEKVRGMNITICTTANNDAHGKALLDALGMPFRK